MKLRRIYRKEATGWGRVRRGGYFGSLGGDNASYLRAAGRSNYGPSVQGNYIGARLFRRIKTKKRQR